MTVNELYPPHLKHHYNWQGENKVLNFKFKTCVRSWLFSNKTFILFLQNVSSMCLVEGNIVSLFSLLIFSLAFACSPVCTAVHQCMPWLWRPEEGLRSLGLELQTIVDCHESAGNLTLPWGERPVLLSTGVLNQWAISPALIAHIFYNFLYLIRIATNS